MMVNYIVIKSRKRERVTSNIQIFTTILVKAVLLLINKAVQTHIKTAEEELVMVLSLDQMLAR